MANEVKRPIDDSDTNNILKAAADRAVEYVFFNFDDSFNCAPLTNTGLRAAIMKDAKRKPIIKRIALSVGRFLYPFRIILSAIRDVLFCSATGQGRT